ncbi:MAG: RNA polymerase sigma factor [Patescibacteria group bacterium]
MRLKLLEQFEDIVQKHQRDILNFHYRLVGNRFEAEDLAQETFLKAYNKLESLKEQDKAKSWLYSIARNVTIDFFRRNKNRSIPLDNVILENYARATAVDYRADVMQSEVSQELQKCLAALSEDDRMIVKLLYYEGFSYKEICDLLNINQNTLKSRLHRARKVLLTAIQANDLLREVAVDYQ